MGLQTKSSNDGWFIELVKGFFILLGCSIVGPYTISYPLSPRKLGRKSWWVACLLYYVSLGKTVLISEVAQKEL